jgi:hypothetical protein
MKLALISLSFLATVTVFAASKPEAKILNSEGVVLVGGKPVGAGQTIKQGEAIVTGADGAVLINLAAGQFVYLSTNSELSMTELKYGPSGTERVSIVKLEKGAMNSEVQKPTQGSTSHTVKTSFGDIHAMGTAWSTSVINGVVTFAVYSGTVSFGGVSVTQGSVASISGGVLTVVNLTTGTTLTYQPGQQEPSPGSATPQQLAGAAAAFGAGARAFKGMATQADQLAYAQIIITINSVLASQGIPGLLDSSAALFAAGSTLGIQGLGNTASPTAP